MNHKFFLSIGPALFLLGLILIGIQPTAADSPMQFETEIERGEYIANLAGCPACHTPFQSKFNDLEALSLEDAREFAFYEVNALDRSLWFAGGRYFDLGPAGGVISRNLTPDKETGLGEWSDAEIEKAIRYGLSRDGHQLFPLMPYNIFRNMAADDMAALIAYLRSLPPIKNNTEHSEHIPAPAVEPNTNIPATAPDPTDTAVRGKYIMEAVMTCNDCHTPLNPETGAPMMEQYFGGGQPFEGPWGIVYGGNITPHPTAGIGDWSNDEIKRVLYSGVRPDGRRLILMPWELYAGLTSDDATAVVNYLRHDVPAIADPAPAVAVATGFEEYIEISDVIAATPTTTDGEDSSNPLGIFLALVLLLAVVGGLFFVLRQRTPPPPPIKK